MITALIFALHIIFGIYIFTYKWQRESLSSAFTNVILIIILFSVGWSLLTMLIKVIVPQEGLGVHFDRDAIILTILTIIEFFFYRVYYNEKDDTTEDDKERQ